MCPSSGHGAVPVPFVDCCSLFLDVLCPTILCEIAEEAPFLSGEYSDRGKGDVLKELGAPVVEAW